MSDIKEKFGIGYLIRDDKTPATFEAPQGNAGLFDEQRAEIARLTEELEEEKRQRAIAWNTYEEMSAFADVMMNDKRLALESNAQQAARIRELEGEAGRLAAIINGDRDLRYIKRLLENNADLAQQVTDLTAANELLQGDAVGEVCTPCDPIFDATDAACACWQRGNDYAFAMLMRHVTAILDGKDDGSGANHEPWRTVRRRLLAMVQALNTIAHDHGQQAGLIDQHWSVVLGWAQDIAKHALFATAAQDDAEATDTNADAPCRLPEMTASENELADYEKEKAPQGEIEASKEGRLINPADSFAVNSPVLCEHCGMPFFVANGIGCKCPWGARFLLMRPQSPGEEG